MAWFKSSPKIFKSSISIWVICLSALVLTALMALIAIWIEQAYFEHYSYFYDPVAYLVYNARLFTRLADEGSISLALNEKASESVSPSVFSFGSLVNFTPIAPYSNSYG